MDTSQLREVVKTHSKIMIEFMGLYSWGISFLYEHLDNSAAQCRPDAKYQNAKIVFDSESFKTEDEVLDMLFHELCHVQTACYDQFAEAASINAPEYMQHLYSYCSERYVLIMELMWRNHLRAYYLQHFEKLTNAVPTKTRRKPNHKTPRK